MGSTELQRPLSRRGEPAKTASNDDRSEAIADQLLAAAEQCFHRFGVAKTTMDDVAAAAGLSRRTIYRYFKNRDALVLAFLVRGQREFNERARTVIAAQPTFDDAVTEALVLAVTAGVSDPHVRVILRPDAVSLASELIGASEAFHAAASDLWPPLLRAGISTGEARPNLDVDRASRWLVDVSFLFATRVLEGAIKKSELPHLIRDFVLPGLTSVVPVRTRA